MSFSTIYGLHAVKKMLQSAAEDALELHCLQNRNQRLQQLISLARQKNLEIVYATRQQLDALAGTDKHQGCVLKVRAGHSKVTSLQESIQNLDHNDLFLVLDGVQDPHNLGACLRTADAAGVKAVIVPKDRAVGMTPVVRKVAAGAAESVPLITVTNLVRSLKDLQAAGVWLLGTTGEATTSLYEQDLTGPLALVMGAEGEGIRRLTAETCDYLVRLPMRGQVESLNVSVATGICLYEINRQRSR
ncbi:MAG: 23S rRNA (guanosine(2251)-2'-O)-methyltransferase RlmB [Gammaproteobacteria bacterium]|nr:23S rRNA (guanosine(2251)-2'-O)-methyltransferase RlmB [Gammaproteobacteria bacterium]